MSKRQLDIFSGPLRERSGFELSIGGWALLTISLTHTSTLIPACAADAGKLTALFFRIPCSWIFLCASGNSNHVLSNETYVVFL